MDEQEARQLLGTAVAKRDATKATAEQAREQLFEVIRAVAPTLRQVDIVAATGWTREYIRKIVDGGRA